MSTELMTCFLEGLHASRLLDNDRIEELLRRPEPPQGDMDGVARFIESKGWLTRFQIDEIRDGRAGGLTFAGYRLLERLPDMPGGAAYRAFHPALQKAVVLRWVNKEWLEPADSLATYLERARGASLVSHPHVLGVLDAGMIDDRAFIVQELVDGADLASLVREMGALPVMLACEYARQTATALHAGAERGIVHGDLAPSRTLLTPVVRKPGNNGTGQLITRPAPGAAVKVCELGLVPVRPPLGGLSGKSAMLGEFLFAAPECLARSVRDARSDIWSLGASLYFMLGARPLYAANSTDDFFRQLQQTEPMRIDRLRNDVPAALADLVHRLLARDPAQRPENADTAAKLLAPFTQYNQVPVAKPIATPAVALASETGTIPKPAPMMATLVEEPPMAEVLPHVEPLPAGTSDSQVYRPRTQAPEPLPLPDDHHRSPFDTASSGGMRAIPARRPEKKKKGGSSWIILAILLHLIPITVAVLYFTDTWPFGRPVSTTTEEEKPQKDAPKKKLNKPSKVLP